MGTFDIFFISETIIDSYFTNAQFNIPEYQIFQKDHNNFGSYIRQDFNCKILQKYIIPRDYEIFTLDLKLPKSKELKLSN